MCLPPTTIQKLLTIFSFITGLTADPSLRVCRI